MCINTVYSMKLFVKQNVCFLKSKIDTINKAEITKMQACKQAHTHAHLPTQAAGAV